MTEMPTREELRAFVGPAADYYLAAWEPALAGTGPVTAGPRWAFLFTFFWLGFRRMTGRALVIVALIAAEFLGEAVVTAVGVDLTEWDTLLSAAVGLGVAVTCTVRGNAWYLQLAREEIADVRAAGLPAAEHLAAVAARGGRSGVNLVVVVVAWVVAIGLVSFAAVALTGQ